MFRIESNHDVLCRFTAMLVQSWPYTPSCKLLRDARKTTGKRLCVKRVQACTAFTHYSCRFFEKHVTSEIYMGDEMAEGAGAEHTRHGKHARQEVCMRFKNQRGSSASMTRCPRKKLSSLACPKKNTKFGIFFLFSSCRERSHLEWAEDKHNKVGRDTTPQLQRGPQKWDQLGSTRNHDTLQKHRTY